VPLPFPDWEFRAVVFQGQLVIPTQELLEELLQKLQEQEIVAVEDIEGSNA
jgi:predicted FMN-binding regulatory protein PaiB